MEKLLIVGAGGHAKVVTDLVLENKQYELVGYIDSDFSKKYRDICVVGEDADLSKFYEEGVSCVFVALGNNQLRQKIQVKCEKIGYAVVNIISSRAYISPTVEMGKGNVIMNGAILHASTRLGNGCIINTNASVDHDCVIGDYTHVAPGVAISGFTHVGRECCLGTGSRIIDRIVVGDRVTLGAGGVIINNVENDTIVVGVPAKNNK